MYIYLFIAIPILGFIYGCFEPLILGKLGERKVRKILESIKPEGYRIINDLMIKTSKGTSQIDHIAISQYGIFVIETKNYKGWIFGNEKSDNWTQVIYKSKRKFHNPVRQNWGHIQALKEVLNNDNIPYYSIVVFSNRAELKDVKSNSDVIYVHQLKEAIKNLSIVEKLSNLEIEQIEVFLKSLSIENKQQRKDHIKNINQNIKNKNSDANSLICPTCGANLVKRNGQYGEFYGCSNFPKCRYKKNHSF